jgi:hypothetical protein
MVSAVETGRDRIALSMVRRLGKRVVLKMTERKLNGDACIGV